MGRLSRQSPGSRSRSGRSLRAAQGLLFWAFPQMWFSLSYLCGLLGPDVRHVHLAPAGGARCGAKCETSTGAEQNMAGLVQSSVAPQWPAKQLVSGSPAPCSRVTLASASEVRPSLASGGLNLASQASSSAAVGLAPPQPLPQGFNKAVLET